MYVKSWHNAIKRMQRYKKKMRVRVKQWCGSGVLAFFNSFRNPLLLENGFLLLTLQRSNPYQIKPFIG